MTKQNESGRNILIIFVMIFALALVIDLVRERWGEDKFNPDDQNIKKAVEDLKTNDCVLSKPYGYVRIWKAYPKYSNNPMVGSLIIDEYNSADIGFLYIYGFERVNEVYCKNIPKQ